MTVRQITQSFRFIFRSRTFSVLNIVGLAAGIACAALILLWVEDEVTYNEYPKGKQLYAVYQNQTWSGETRSVRNAPNPLAAALQDEVPGIKNVMRYSSHRGGQKSVFATNEKMLYEIGVYADASIFDMLDIQFVQGDANTAFDAACPLVITEQMAARFFGKDDPVGQTLKMDNEQEYIVTAVIKSQKRNSDFIFSWVIPFRQLVKNNVENGWQDAETTWNSNWMADFVELEASADVAQVNDRIKNMLKEKKQNPDEPSTLFLYPLSKIHLYGDFKDGKPTGSGLIRYVKLFSWIAAIILVIACINFMNLSTARSQKRIKEVGVRKTFGAKRIRLIRQFLSETGLITWLALLLAGVFVLLILPYFNLLVEKDLTLRLDNPVHWLGLLGVGLVCTLVAGSYPAFFLSSFPPMDVLRKLQTRMGGGVVRLRQVLVTFQFAASLTLIICTAFVYLQVQHTKNRSLGMDVEQVLMVEANDDIRNHFEPLKQELLTAGIVENLGLSNQRIMEMRMNGAFWKWRGKPDDVDPLVYIANVTEGVFPALDIKVIEGRNYEPGDGDKSYIIINRAFAELMGDEGRVGGRVWRGSNPEDEQWATTIIGIVDNFVFNDAYSTEHKPAAFYPWGGSNTLFVRLKPGDIQGAIQKVESAVRQVDPYHPFEYHFMDEQFSVMFKSTLLVGRLAGLFAALAIFISCLGLFGLTAFAAEQRTREIGIRKVLGASVKDIVVMLGRDFMVWIGVAFAVAVPIAWWVMQQWLQDYGYRIGLSWWVFAVSGLLVAAIALFTVSTQAVKAATANPIKAIKSE